MNVKNHLAGTMQPAIILKGHIPVCAIMVMSVMGSNVQVSRHKLETFTPGTKQYDTFYKISLPINS